MFEPDSDDGYLNHGKMSNTTEWPWEDVQLPILDYNTKLQFHTKFDVASGGANLDNIFFQTRQKYVILSFSVSIRILKYVIAF